MSRENILDSLLEEFGALVGIPELKLDEEGRCNLMFDDVAISFELAPEKEAVYLYSYLGDVSQGESEALFATLLDANYLFHGTNGATIGVDKASGRVVLVRLTDLATLRLPQFESLVEDFVNLAELWQDKLANFSVENKERPLPEEPQHVFPNKV